MSFADKVKVDSADAAQVRMDAKHVAKVGEIIVSVYNTRLGHIEEASYATNNPREVREVSEKALKGQAISHSVG